MSSYGGGEARLETRAQGLPWWSSALESALQRGRGSIPGQGTKIPQTAEQLSLRTTTTEP